MKEIKWEGDRQPAELMEILTNEITNALLDNGAKWRIRNREKKKHNPEVDEITKLAEKIRRKIRKQGDKGKRKQLIDQLRKVMDELEVKSEEILENKERKLFQEALKDARGIFQHIRNFKRDVGGIGPVKDKNGNVIYKEKEKRELFADFYSLLQTLPQQEHIINDWDDFLGDGSPTPGPSPKLPSARSHPVNSHGAHSNINSNIIGFNKNENSAFNQQTSNFGKSGSSSSNQANINNHYGKSSQYHQSSSTGRL